MGIGDWAQSPIPNPQSPIPNPQLLFFSFKYILLFYKKLHFNFIYLIHLLEFYYVLDNINNYKIIFLIIYLINKYKIIFTKF